MRPSRAFEACTYGEKGYFNSRTADFFPFAMTDVARRRMSGKYIRVSAELMNEISELLALFRHHHNHLKCHAVFPRVRTGSQWASSMGRRCYQLASGHLAIDDGYLRRSRSKVFYA